MDPSGPWSSYTYNRIAVSGVSTANAATPTSTGAAATVSVIGSTDYHNHQQSITTISGQTLSNTSPTSTILLQPIGGNQTTTTFNPSGFISSTSGSYDQVLSPIFQHSGAKTVGNYNTTLNSHRQNLNTIQVTVNAGDKTVNTRHNYTNHDQQSQQLQQQQHFYTEHSTNDGSPPPATSVVSGTALTWPGGTSQINVTDPFTILSQENVVQAASPGQSSGGYSSPFPITQTHLGQIKMNTRSSTSTQVAGSKTTIHSPSTISTVAVSSGIQNSTSYYRQPATITSYTDSSGHVGNISNSNKSISISNTSPLNQTCILVTTSAPIQDGGGTQQIAGNQKYVKKQNMYNNSARTAGKTTIMSTSGNPENIIANTVTNNGNNNYQLAGTTLKGANQSLQLVQTKAETKVYPELVFVDENDRAKLAEIHQSDPQDGSISYYTIMDGRLVYTGNSNVIINEVPKGRTVSNIQSPRQFVLSNSSEIFASDANRLKPEQTYTMTSMPTECTNAIIVPRKQSPSHSTSSQAASPAYPIYNSPMNSIESPSQHSATSTGTTHSSDNSGHIVIYKTNPQNQAQIATHSSGNLDVSATARNPTNNSYTNTNSPVVYSSVITRALVNEQGKVYSNQPTACWDNDIKSKKFYTINSGNANEIVVPADIQLKSSYYDPSGNSTQIGALHGLKTEEPHTENIVVTTDNPLASQIQITKLNDQSAPPQIIRQSDLHSAVQSHSITQQTPVVHHVITPRTKRKRMQKVTKTREQLLSENEFLVNRVPSQTHITKTSTFIRETSPNITIQQINVCPSLSQQENGGSYYENKWNTHSNVTQAAIVPETASMQTEITNYNSPQQIVQQQQQPQQQQVLMSHQSSHDTHSAQTYYTNYPISAYIPGQVTSAQPTLEVPTQTAIEVQQQQPLVEVTQQIITQNPMLKTIEDNLLITEESLLPKPEDKVVVPDIEEELKFLTSNSFEPIKVSKTPNSAYVTPVLKSTSPTQPKTFKLPNSAATGFMSSYLKFLQGEPESSPPPLGRLQKKAIYQKTNSTTTGNTVNSGSIVLKSSNGSNVISTIKNNNGTLFSTVLAVNELDTGINSQQLQVLQSENSLIPIQSSSNQMKLPLTTSSTAQIATTTTTTSIASTQTINKKRKAVENYSIDDNNQKRNNIKMKSVAEIAVQTASHPVMLPKKARPQMAMQMASMQQNKMQNVIIKTHPLPTPICTGIPQSTIISTTPTVVTSPLKGDALVRTVQQSQVLQDTSATYDYPEMEEDSLIVPPRRETSHRRAKTRGIREIMQKDFYHDDAEEPPELFDSDTDPVWTPKDNDDDSKKIGRNSKRKVKKTKTTYSRSRKLSSNILTAAVMGAGINDSDADNNTQVGDVIKQGGGSGDAKIQIDSQKGLNQEAIKAQAQHPSATNTEIVTIEFKTGDYVILRSDLVKDWPPLWQVDGKLILQMFEAFNKEGKILYKNRSKYSAWNNDSKKLYVTAPVSLLSHNKSETLIELNKSKLYGTELEQYARKVMNDYLAFRDNFEVYVQTLISQSLDQSFFNVIAKEEDDYFLSNVKIIENIMENCKRKLLLITELPGGIIASIETWSVFNTIIDLGHNEMNEMYCIGCRNPGVTSRFLLFGQPYNFTTMMPGEPDPNIKYETEMVFCQSCVTRAELLHKIIHEKYNLYQICLRKVQDQQIANQAKGTTAILTDLLADSDWIDQLFLNVRASWTEVEVMERIVHFYRLSQ